jgi:malonyl-CoA O-methyltransferase
MHHIFIPPDHLQPQTPPATPPVVFLPGWGFDGRITELFEQHARPWIYPATMLDPTSLTNDLFAFLNEKGIDRIELKGWSMGGYLALDFARQYPDRVAAQELIGMRGHWPTAEIDAIIAELQADPAAFLHTFYRKCFLGHKSAYRIFVKNLQNDYLGQLDMKLLLKGLAYLNDIHINHVPGIPTRLVHGSNDIIAPLAERANIPEADVEIVEQGGHMPFLSPTASLNNTLQKQKDFISRRFSRAAATYDEYALLQKELAQRLDANLAETTEALQVQRILEIGCGTGSYTGLLAARFPRARIVALDFAAEMVRTAEAKLAGRPGMQLICIDGEEYLETARGGEGFDLISSNATLQWFTNLRRSLANIAGLLNPGGHLLATIFGSQTLQELSRGLSAVCDRDIELAAHDFPDQKILQNLLRSFFAHITVERIKINRHYPSCLDLLMQIKKTGTSGWRAGKGIVFTRTLLRSLDQWFKTRHGGCRVSYEIFFVNGRK